MQCFCQEKKNVPRFCNVSVIAWGSLAVHSTHFYDNVIRSVLKDGAGAGSSTFTLSLPLYRWTWAPAPQAMSGLRETKMYRTKLCSCQTGLGEVWVLDACVSALPTGSSVTALDRWAKACPVKSRHLRQHAKQVTKAWWENHVLHLKTHGHLGQILEVS